MIKPRLGLDKENISFIYQAIILVSELDKLRKMSLKSKRVYYQKTNDCLNDKTISQLTREFEKLYLNSEGTLMFQKISDFLSKKIFKKEIQEITILDEQIAEKEVAIDVLFSHSDIKKELQLIYENLTKKIITDNEIKNEYGKFTNTFLLAKATRDLVEKIELNRKKEIILGLKSIKELTSSLISELEKKEDFSDLKIMLKDKVLNIQLIEQKTISRFKI